MKNRLSKEETKEIIEKAAKLLSPFAKITHTDDMMEVKTFGISHRVHGYGHHHLREELMRMRIYLIEEAEDMRREHEDDIDSTEWCKADDYLHDITRVLDEIIPDEAMTVTASDCNGAYIIEFHQAGLSKDDIREIMEECREVHPDAVYWFDEALYRLGCEPEYRKVTMAL